jgi:glycosyltransferase involved in cell wall biosynthesis
MTDTRSCVDVLVCTYRRPELLLKTLDGIAHSAAGMDGVRIIVVDNDDRQGARQATCDWAAGAGLAVEYLSQPVQNISLTRNLGLAHARAPWLAFIDDDEVPGPRWLPDLLAAAGRYGADVVFAPVVSEFEEGAPRWATQGTLFRRRRFASGAPVPSRDMRTGNVLVRRACLERDVVRFDPELGLSGGEDAALFARLHAAGHTMVWCDEAWVSEHTPRARTSLAWVLRRAFRIGSVEAYNRRRSRRMRAAGEAWLKGGVFLMQGGLLALFWAPLSPARCVQSLFRACLGAGFFYGLLVGPYREYRGRGPGLAQGASR